MLLRVVKILSDSIRNDGLCVPVNKEKESKMNKDRKIIRKIGIWCLMLAMLLQPLALCISGLDLGGGVSLPGQKAEITDKSKLDIYSDEVIAALKKDFMKSLNQDLVQKVSDYELTGEVNVIITFSENSLISSYAAGGSVGKYEDYRTAAATQRIIALAENHRKEVLAPLLESSIISKVKYSYHHLLDGVSVTTTYENLAALCNTEGVGRVLISDTYKPAVAVENPVNVYDTGIFNSSDVEYTGKGTIVAILDTGCDYTHTAFTSHTVVSPLYDRDDIAALLPGTIAYGYDNSLEPREVYYGNITSGKIAFGYDYADRDPDVMPFNSEHGTHVAGIIGGSDSVITGVAVDTQLAIMKVFSDYKEGADDDDIMAALEDSVVLGVDAINMSLGTSCGFSREADDDYKNKIYDNIEKAGISLIVAASNDYSSGYGSEDGNTNKTHNPDSATVGAPSTYDAAFSVASINGNKDKYVLANGDHEVFFHESYNMAGKEYNFFEMMGITETNSAEYEYVTVPGNGYAINYSGLDIKGKIALVKRGDISFEEKAQFAYEAGAIAIIVYNNVFGDIIMTAGNNVKIPIVSIGKDDGEELAKRATGTMKFDYHNQAGPFMSDFSSWGPNPDLTLKPEITAHGGNIYSAVPGGGYDKLSGTSMAAPNMCGIVILIRQYVKENYKDLTTAQVRDMVNQLCMSTATIALDKKSNPYSPRKQGAGIADIAKATTTGAYLYVDGSGKTKLEYGDDPARTGVYTMSINLKNISASPVSYRLGNMIMTETLSSSDPEYVAEMAYMLNNTSDYSVEGGTLADGVVTVQAGATAKVTFTITLSAEDKAYLNSSFKNGMYVEGFITFTNTDENGVDLNAPFLAFYGDWGEAPIFDRDYYEVETEAHNNAIDDDDKIKADYYATTPLGKYYYDYMLPLGSYIYQMDENEYTPIPATAEHAAMSYYRDCINGVYAVFSGLLRGAKELNISVVNTATGQVVWSDTQYNCYKAHYGGTTYPYISRFDLDMANYTTGEVFGDNNSHYVVTMTAKLDWDGERNSSDTYQFSFYIDYEAPTITSAEFRTEYDKTRKENRYYVDLMVYDNHYAMSVRPIIVYDYTNENGETSKTYSSLTDNPIPVYQEERGKASKVTIEITDYIDIIKESAMPEGITFYVDDYALNANICYVNFPETDSRDLDFKTTTLDMDINQSFDLTAYLEHTDSNDPVVTDYLKTLTWASSDSSVVAVHDGQLEALKSGSATITVTSDSWFYMEYGNKKKISKSIVVNVSDKTVENSQSRFTAQLKDLKFTSYDTLFAFNSDIDYSEIGKSGSIQFFDKSNSISFYPAEKVKLHYSLNPWNLDPSRYTLKWTSSNPRVATVDENGVVTAEAEGKCRITLEITIDGRTSTIAARCSIEVKSEFIIENRQLIAYKGKGGDVVIPDDEGINTIGAFAFCHYNLDNKKEVEKDENGSYDFDLKKEPIGNNTVTSVVIPDGVETVDKYAFYNCKLLKKVTLPDTCKTVGAYAFYHNSVLEDINLDHVKVIANSAFQDCERLNCDALGGINLSNVNVIGDNAFTGCKMLTAIDLADLRRSGKEAFKDCTKLATVRLGERSRLAVSVFENTAIQNITIYSDTIPDGAFQNCTKLTSVTIRNDITYLGTKAFQGCTRLNEVNFGGICESMGSNAFYGCTALTVFKMPDCDVTMGDTVFAGSGLKTLIFAPNTHITSLGFATFGNVTGLSFRANESSYYTLTSGILMSKDGKEIVLAAPDAVSGDYVVPAGVTKIGDGAFSANVLLTSLSFADGTAIEEIGNGAFAYCSKLQEVILPDRDVKLGEFAFAENASLTDINLEKVTSVGMYAFAFDSKLTSVALNHEDVAIDFRAFYGCSALRNVSLGAGATIGEYAFSETPVQTVTALGGGVTVKEGAFAKCSKLVSFDFEDVSGKLGDYAFIQCTSLTSAHMPHVTEIGEACFADCQRLSSVSGEKVTVIGNEAFAAYSQTSEHGAIFAKVSFPSLQKVGSYAFLACDKLTEIDLSGVTEIGEGAFGLCAALTKAVLSEKLTDMADRVFYGCTLLSDIDLSKIVRFGSDAFYGVPLPKVLNLDNAEYVGQEAFLESEDPNAHFVETVNAPKLKYVGANAFALCEKLTEFNAPNVEEIAFGAFMYTALEEFEVTPALKKVEYGAFEATPNLKAFYAMADGTKVYDITLDSIMLNEGVLYTINQRGYVLSAYPAAKTNSEYTVVPGTVRIDYRAAVNNGYLTTVTLPDTLEYIGNYAFYGCSKLEKVIFRSYYAPVLEGSMMNLEITPDNVSDYPGFDELYKYDYYYKKENTLAGILHYANFVDVVASKGAQNLICVLPDNHDSGYENVLYSAYFTVSDSETSGKTVGAFAIAFIRAVEKLPEVAQRFDRIVVENAISAYNALLGHEEEMADVDASLITRFTKARTEYNVDVVENMIAHLFDMASNEYSYELVKSTRAAYETLSAEEKALVKNADRLNTKIAELSSVMGKELDFNLSFGDYFKDNPTNPDGPDTPDPEPTPVNPAEPSGMSTWAIVLISFLSIAAVAGISVAVVIVMKKKRTVQ